MTTTTTTTSTAIYVYVYVSIYGVFWFLFWDSLTCGAIYEEHPYAKAGRDGECRGCWLLLDTAAVVAVEEKGATVVEIGLSPWCLGFVLRRKVCNGCWFCARKQTNELACACLRPSPPASLSLSASLTVSLSTACLFVYWLCPG